MSNSIETTVGIGEMRAEELESHAERAPLSENTIFKVHALDTAVKIVRQLAKYGCILGCVYYVWLSVEAIAGKFTSFRATIGADVPVSISVDPLLGYLAFGEAIVILMLLAIVWYQSRHNEKTIQHFSAHNRKLEELIDPNRSSSNLTETGRTNPDDR